MKIFEIKKVTKVTQEEIDDILTTAFEGGITYWCDKVRIKEGFDAEEEYEYISEALTRGATLELHDAEEDEWLTLTLDNFLNTLAEYQFYFDNYDASDADQIVQRSVFDGDVTYA